MIVLKLFHYNDFISCINENILDSRYHKLIKNIAKDNIENDKKMLSFSKQEGPYDVLAHLLGLMDYNKFIDNYNEINKKSVAHIETDEFDSDLLNIEWTALDLSNFRENNIYPLRLTDNEMFFAVPDNNFVKNSKISMIIAEIQQKYVEGILKRPNLAIKAKVVSNLTFLNLQFLYNRGKEIQLSDFIYKYERIMNTLLIQGIVKNATDIYFDPKETHINIYFGIFNEMIKFKVLDSRDIDVELFMSTMIKFAGHTYTSLDWTGNPSKDMNINDLGELNKRYTGRLQIIKNNFGYSPVLRIQDTERTAPEFSKLNLSPDIKDKLNRIFMNPTGIILIAGATGNGKTTTIYACLENLVKVRPFDRIEEVSKPVEVRLDYISQISLEDNGALDFAHVLEAQTRRNAKVIFLGEFNSSKSARFGVDAALQSKLLISTIHTDSVSMIPDRLKGLAISDPAAYEQFIEVVKGLTHQLMLKEVCPSCKKKKSVTTLTTEEQEVLRDYSYTENTITLVEPEEHCPICEGRGYIVDKPIISVELLEINDSTRDLLRHAIREGNVRNKIENLLMVNKTTGVHDALKYVKDGALNWEQVWYKYALWNKVGRKQ